MILIKFCGLRRSEDVEAAVRAGADLVGFILSPRFRRFIEPSLAGSFEVPEGVRKVGVFVDEPMDYVVSCASYIDIIQLHGNEDEAYISGLRKRTGGAKKIIKVFIVRDISDIEAANMSSADMVLLDAGVGGTGKQFDHLLLSHVKRDYILAGGLNDANVSPAIEQGGPHLLGVDTSSGVETDGVKDFGKMRRFASEVKNRSI